MKTIIALCLAAAVSAHTYVKADSHGVTPEVTRAVLAEDWPKVVEFLAQVDSNTKSPVLRLLKGHACLAANRNNESARLLRDMGKSEERSEWQSWTVAFSSSHPGSAAATYLKGDSLARNQMYEEAIGTFTEGLRRTPNHPLLLNARAICYASLSKWNESIVDLDDAAKANPKLAEIHANRGCLNVRRSLGGPGAFTAFNRALSISPDFVLAQIGKASALYGIGRWSDAQELFEKCSSDPDNGHLAAINAALLRDATSKAEFAAIDEKTAGVAITKAAREQQTRVDSINQDIFKNDMGRIRNTFVADSLRDISQPVKAIADTFKGVMDLSKGDIAGGAGKLAGVGGTIGNNAKNIAGLHDQLSKQSAQDWSKGISTMQTLRSSGLQGGVSTEDLRRGFVDKGDWRLLARFALQYPESKESTPLGTKPQPAH
jgi:tetratricopeptide (TPR) repeat protein